MQKAIKDHNSKNYDISYNNSVELVKKSILGVGITDVSQNTILEFIIKNLQNSSKPYCIVTPNPEMIVLASKNSEFKRVLNSAKIATNDGVGIGLAAKVMGISLGGRFTGVELMEKLCERANDWPITIGFLGGGPNVAELTAECLLLKYPTLKVTFVGQEWGKEGFDLPERFTRIRKETNTDKKIRENPSKQDLRKSIDVLFIAFGAPKQEFWMAENVGKIPVQVMVGVGGAFDQIVTPSLRPPQLLQNLGLGWLYRLIREPWRIKRQLALLEFIWMVARKRIDMSFRRNKVTEKSH